MEESITTRWSHTQHCISEQADSMHANALCREQSYLKRHALH